jgi:hypothetical protein
MPNIKYKEFLRKHTTEDIINKMEEELNGLEEATLGGYSFSPAMISKLKNAYGNLKTISPSNATKLNKILDKVNKDGLIDLYKAKIPFVSIGAGGKLSQKHNLSPKDINKLREEAPANSVSSGGVDMAPNAGHPNVMKKHIRRNKKDQEDLTKKIGKMVKDNKDNNNNILKGVNETLEKLESKIDEVSGIDNTIKFEEEKPYQTFSEKFKVGK